MHSEQVPSTACDSACEAVVSLHLLAGVCSECWQLTCYHRGCHAYGGSDVSGTKQWAERESPEHSVSWRFFSFSFVFHLKSNNIVIGNRELKRARRGEISRLISQHAHCSWFLSCILLPSDMSHAFYKYTFVSISPCNLRNYFPTNFTRLQKIKIG